MLLLVELGRGKGCMRSEEVWEGWEVKGSMMNEIEYATTSLDAFMVFKTSETRLKSSEMRRSVESGGQTLAS